MRDVEKKDLDIKPLIKDIEKQYNLIENDLKIIINNYSNSSDKFG